VRSLRYEHGLGGRFGRTDRLAKAQGPEDGGQRRTLGRGVALRYARITCRMSGHSNSNEKTVVESFTRRSTASAGWVLRRGVPRPAAVSHLIDPVGTVLTSTERRRRGFAGSAPRESEAGAILSVGRESPLYNAGLVGSAVVRSTPSLLRGAA
jgi:hypothetical protein